MSPQAVRGLTLLLVATFTVAACADEPEEPTPSLPQPLSCIASTFPLKALEMPEASGAAWVSCAAGDGWLIVADNGNDGRATLLGADGTLLAELELPLDEGAGDDMEGLAWSAGRLIGLTSSGYIRQWSLDTVAPQLIQLAQAISEDAQWMCGAQENNCGPNWEGLCLDPAPEPGGCAGFVVSKTLGELVCLRASGASYTLDPTIRIEVTKEGRLSGCDYEPQSPYRLIVAGNDEAQNKLWEITTPRDLSTAQSEKLEIEGTLNQEAIAFGPQGVLLSFGDEETITGEGSAIVSFYCL